MKILTVVGARPQFVKAGPVSAAFRDAGIEELLIHTGQHYDPLMSQIFFDELNLKQPTVNLGIGSGSHGKQTGLMLAALEEVMLETSPTAVLVYGDTNSTLAAAIAAVKLHIPLAHVEAGLRSYNREMPEEHNRVLTDHCSDFLYCPTARAVQTLSGEGITEGVVLAGDPMYDAVLQLSRLAQDKSDVIRRLDITAGEYVLATIHRPANTDSVENLTGILEGLAAIGRTVVFPAHPRTRKYIEQYGLPSMGMSGSRVRMVDPVGYLDMLCLEQSASAIITDSGGVQKEAFFMSVPCVTVRTETEWLETVESGWNILAAPKANEIATALQRPRPAAAPPDAFGDGTASRKIVRHLQEALAQADRRPQSRSGS